MTTRFAYKLLRLRKDGSLGPLFINRRMRVPVGEWLSAENHPTKGYAVRQGWHATTAPGGAALEHSLADKTPITCCGDFRDEKHWEAFKRVEALRCWRVHESEKVNLVETPNAQVRGCPPHEPEKE